MQRLQDHLGRRERARDVGYAMLKRALHFYGGLHPESFEGKMVYALKQTLECLDEEREVLFALVSGKGVVADDPLPKEPPSGYSPPSGGG